LEGNIEFAEKEHEAMGKSEGTADIPRRPLGKTGMEVTAIALGGYHLGLVKTKREAVRIVQEAFDQGITFMDNAWEYHDGLSEEIMGQGLQGRRHNAFLMSKVCTHGRGSKVAMKQLHESLKRLKTDYLDLWQIHEVVYDNDPELHFAKGGVIEALEKAKSEGKVRFVGFTGHKDPAIHLKMLSYNYPFDTCQLPLNVLDGTFRSFEQQVLPALNLRGIAALRMKSMCGDGGPVKKKVVTAAEALQYALSLPVAAVVSGVDSMKVLRQNLRILRNFRPMSPDEMEQLRSRCATWAADGRLELYKTSKAFDGPPGRNQHGFPPLEELAA
jgi:aryl-alcohol dehydrogenase-like predicted oxidoreductase